MNSPLHSIPHPLQKYSTKERRGEGNIHGDEKNESSYGYNEQGKQEIHGGHRELNEEYLDRRTNQWSELSMESLASRVRKTLGPVSVTF